MSDREDPQPGHEPHSLRESLVGDEDARALGVDDDERTAPATMVLGVLLVVAAIVTVVDALRLPDSDDTVGPATAPIVVGVLLGVVGIGLVVQGRRAMGVWEYSEHTTRQQWLRLAAVLGTLVVYAAVVPYLGFVLSSTLLFTVSALLLGAPNRARALAYGWIVASVVFLVFDELIGITLPAGPWGF